MGVHLSARVRAWGRDVSERGEEKGRASLAGPAHGRRGADGPPSELGSRAREGKKRRGTWATGKRGWSRLG